MFDEARVYAVEAPEELDRLRKFVAARGPAPAGVLSRHLARPRYRPSLTRVAERGGAIVGYALLGHARLRLGAATIETGQIEALTITPAGRAAGLFEPLIGDCLRTLVEEQLPLAMVAGPRELYEPLGFAPHRFTSTVEVPLGTNTHPQHGDLREAVEADLDDLAALYEASYQAIPLADLRAQPDWRWLLDGRAIRVLEDRRRRAIAYAALAPGQPGVALGCDEAAAADSGAARCLLHALAGLARHANPSRLQLALPLDHRVAQAALHLGGEGHLVATAGGRDATALAGVVDLPELLAALGPEFERRLALSRYAGWSGNLRVEIATERITLALAAGRATVIDGSRPADVRLRRVELPALAQLCLGFRSASDLRATGGLDCDDSALGLIDALFPVVMGA